MNNSQLFADVSSNDGFVNVPAYASSRYGALMIKATEAGNYVNPLYHNQVVVAHRHDLPVFHYHFCRPEHGQPQTEAEHLWHTIESHFRRPGDYVVWDLETDDPATGARWLLEADTHLRAISGTEPWCYSFLSYILSGNVRVHSNKFHVAAWGNTRPGSRFSWNLNGRDINAWQYTDGSVGGFPRRFSGISVPCDGNQLNPSLARDLSKVRHPR